MLKRIFILKKLIPINFFIISFFISIPIFCQVKDNLEIFYTLIDSSGMNIVKNLAASKGELSLNFNLGEAYSLFQNHLESIFYKNGYSVNSKDSVDNKITINYVLDNAEVNYGDIFRAGLFGSYMLPRIIKISGNYSIRNDSFLYKEFHYNYLDTVKVDNIKTLENNSYPFTEGNVPAEPFFSSLFEPLVAIGTAAIAVYLFFTIRSK
jgi:hypothetical protein